MLAEQKGDDKKSAKKLLDSDDDEDDKPKKGGKKGSDDDSGDESDGGKKKKDGKKGKEDTEEDRKAASDNHAQAMKMKQAMNQRDIGEVRNKVDNDEDDDAGSVDFKSVCVLACKCSLVHTRFACKIRQAPSRSVQPDIPHRRRLRRVQAAEFQEELDQEGAAQDESRPRRRGRASLQECVLRCAC